MKSVFTTEYSLGHKHSHPGMTEDSFSLFLSLISLLSFLPLLVSRLAISLHSLAASYSLIFNSALGPNLLYSLIQLNMDSFREIVFEVIV